MVNYYILYGALSSSIYLLVKCCGMRCLSVMLLFQRVEVYSLQILHCETKICQRRVGCVTERAGWI